MIVGALTLRAENLSDAQRTSLAEWQAQLEKLVIHQRTCRARAVHGDLGRHLQSPIRGAHEAIAEILLPAARELLTAAAEQIACYFSHGADARDAAKRFCAFVAMDGFLRGPKPEETLAALGDQAEASAALIARLISGEPVWHFAGSAK